MNVKIDVIRQINIFLKIEICTFFIPYESPIGILSIFADILKKVLVTSSNKVSSFQKYIISHNILNEKKDTLLLITILNSYTNYSLHFLYNV